MRQVTLCVVPTLLGLLAPCVAAPETPRNAFGVTEGLDLIWRLHGDPANVVLPSVTAELQGLRYFDSEYRWPAVIGQSGSITVTVPRAGRFYPAIVVYDMRGAQAYTLEVGGHTLGSFTAREDDNRQRVYFLQQPVELRAGDRLTFRLHGEATHITEDILLLAERPPIRSRTFAIGNIEARRVRRQTGGDSIRITWTTTWPTACTIEHGTAPGMTERHREGAPVANHRVFLPVPTGGKAFHYRILAPRPDGSIVAGRARKIPLTPPDPIAGRSLRARVPLKVENPHPFALRRAPVTGGVPVARGALGDADHVRLLDPRGVEQPVQVFVAARWQDGSVKWLRVSFLADVGAQSAATYTLEHGRRVTPARLSTPLQVARQGSALTVDTGLLRARFDAARGGLPVGLWLLSGRNGGERKSESAIEEEGLVAEVVGPDGRRYTTLGPAESLEVEEAGPVRVVVKSTGHHRSADGSECFAYVCRAAFWAGASSVRLSYTWGNDREEEFSDFQAIRLRALLPEDPTRRWRVGLGEGREAWGAGELALTQLRDDSCQVVPEPDGGPVRRAGGWVDVAGERWEMTAAVRHFWQLYPKGLRVDAGGLTLELCPDFPEGTYDGCSKLDEIKLCYYLMGGRYRVRRGLQKQHEVLLSFRRAVGGASAAAQAALAFQEPLVLACQPEHYCRTGVFGEILPATAGRSAAYEEVCERVYRGYLQRRESGREYGLLNFGDEWGERRVNWANGEYDHHHAFLMQFIRTGDRKWYLLGEQAARHAMDVDTCHYGPGRGGVWVHAMGHTGGYFKEPYEGEGIPEGGFSPSHTWTEGFCDWYFLSGDPTGAETAALVADFYDGAYLNNYDYSNCRDNGWHLLLTLAAYRATGDPYYLNAARIIVERTLERQTPGGGWHRQMVPGHCYCMPRHRGEANFMLGVLACGLEEYYREVRDPRVAEAILGGARQVVAELWVPETDGFRYTSCPKMGGYTANNDMTAEVLFFARRLGGPPEFGEIALRAMDAAFKDGISSIAHLRWTPHILYNIDLLRRGAPTSGRASSDRVSGRRYAKQP